MRSIPKERILRVNCSGFGQAGFWDPGASKSLNDYSVILVNPVSISHMFQKDPELSRAVDQAMLEGASSYSIDSDDVLHEMASDVEIRIRELETFLMQGGLLLYFLCRPFTIQGPSIALDNYYWLESLAPDQPTSNNGRHMSAVSHGRLVEPTEIGLDSEFHKYLSLNALEWSTLIRSEYLTEGYHTLATAGANKCIAGQLYIVESNGRVVFLPSPYSPDFERTLLECIADWYNQKEPSQEELEAERAAAAFGSGDDLEQSHSGIGGPDFFEDDQGEMEPAQPASHAPSAAGVLATQSALPEEEEDSFASELSSSVEEDAKRFEQDVAERVSEQQKKKTGGLDLSIFQQTAKELVSQTESSPASSATEVNISEDPIQEEVPSIPEVPEISEQDDGIFDDMQTDFNDESFIGEGAGEEPLEENSIDSIVLSDLSDLNLDIDSPFESGILEMQEEETVPTPEPTPVASVAPQSVAPASVAPASPQNTHAAPTPNFPEEEEAPDMETNNANDGEAIMTADNNQGERETPKPVLGNLFKKSGQQPAQRRTRNTMPETTSNWPAPEWSKQFTFSYLDQLNDEHANLTSQMEALQGKLDNLSDRIGDVENLKRALLAGQGSVLIEACATVLNRLGWNVAGAGTADNELLLSLNNHPESMVRIVYSEGECDKSEIVHLQNSALEFWTDHEIEPKGIIIACTWATTSPSDRASQDFPDALRKIAAKKTICLLNTVQLLGIYRDLEMGAINADVVRKQMLETNGRLEGFQVQPLLATV